MRTTMTHACRLTIVTVFLSAGATSASASPVPFSVVDLGTGNATFFTDASGQTYVLDSSGHTAYAFNPANATVSDGTLTQAHSPVPNGFPVVQPAPVYATDTYGNPANAFSVESNFLTNGNGFAVAIDTVGVRGHSNTDQAFFSQQNADGSWGTPIGMWSGNTRFMINGPTPDVWIDGISKTNLVLGTVGVGGLSGLNLLDAAVYDINKRSFLDLTQYLYNVSAKGAVGFATLGEFGATGWWSAMPIGIDQDGRILVSAAAGVVGQSHTLLLTPDGLTSDQVTVPEPGSMALAVVAALWFAYRMSRMYRASVRVA